MIKNKCTKRMSNSTRAKFTLKAAFCLLLLIFAAPSLAQEVLTLKPVITDEDGRITIDDVFDNSQQSSDVVLGRRVGSTAVLDAGRVQILARQAGAIWDNPKGLRRIIVTSGQTSAPTKVIDLEASKLKSKTREVLVFTRTVNTGEIIGPTDIAFKEMADYVSGSSGLILDPTTVIGKTVRLPIREGGVIKRSDLTSPIIIKRLEQVRVIWRFNDMTLAMTGIAQKDASIGDLISIQNPQSKKIVEAIVIGPGQAATGPEAERLRQHSLLSLR
jgi:flagellar basal body P-ring formation protein FlgA